MKWLTFTKSEVQVRLCSCGLMWTQYSNERGHFMVTFLVHWSTTLHTQSEQTILTRL